MRPDVSVVEALKEVARSFGRRVRRTESLSGGFAVVGVNGRSVYFDVLAGGLAVRWDAYEDDGSRVPLRNPSARTDRPGWELEVEESLEDVL